MYQALVTPEDINQEMEILRLRGVPNPSSSIVRMKMERKSSIEPNYQDLFDLDDPEGEVDIPEPLRDPSPQEELILWAMGKSVEIQGVIDAFLEDPDTRLESTIEFLAELSLVVSLPQNRPSSKRITYTDIMTRALPASKDDLIRCIGRVGTMERPAATVRSFLRRFANRLHISPEGIYSWK